jgi:phosphoribosylformylglycinamidine cyclo-ligase
MVAILDAASADLAIAALAARGMQAWVAGAVTKELANSGSYLSGDYK